MVMHYAPFVVLVQALLTLSAGEQCSDTSCHPTSSSAALLQLSKQAVQELPTKAKEAVVLVTGVFDECQAKRALALAASQDEARDFYIFYDPELQTNSSFELMSALSPFLTSVPQPAVPNSSSFASFEVTTRAGHSKGSFLLWASRYAQTYRHFWHIEDDMLLSGDWAPFFDHFSASTSDLVGNFLVRDTPLHLGIPCSLTSNMNCTDVQDVQGFQTTAWSGLRVSGDFATTMAQSMEEPGHMGHAEDITAAACMRLDWCRREQIPRQFIGFWRLGGGDITACSAELQEMCPQCIPCTYESLAAQVPAGQSMNNRLWHPVKCSLDKMGDPHVGDKALAMANSTGKVPRLKTLQALRSLFKPER